MMFKIRRWTRILFLFFSLFLISVGSYLIYEPLGLLVPGLLIWIDISLPTRKIK